MRRGLTPWLVRVLAAVCLGPIAALAGTATTQAGATTGSPKWATTSLPNPLLRQGQLASISCTTATACVGVGYSESPGGTISPITETLTTSGWVASAAPAPHGSVFAQLLGVSCRGADCEAVGMWISGAGKTAAFAARWNGSKWATQSVPAPSGTSAAALEGVSCTGATSCVAVGHAEKGGSYTTLAVAFTGTSWALQTTPNPGSPDQLNGVSCTSASACVAVGSSGFNPGTTVALKWSGSKWTSIAPPNPSNSPYSELLAVSCASTCIAVGDTYPPGFATQSTLVEQYKGSTWTIMSSPDPGGYDNQLNGVSCESATDCTAVGQYVSSDTSTAQPLAMAWHGTSWSAETVPVPTGVSTSYLESVSCPTSSACVAGGANQPSKAAGVELVAVATSSGSTWTAPAAPSPRGAESAMLGAISCSSATACETVGFATNGTTGGMLAEHLSGTTWKIQKTSTLHNFTADGVSCAGSSCLAVGWSILTGAPMAAEWNGTAWSNVSVPVPSGATEVDLFGVSCASSSYCIIAGAADSDSSNQAFAATWTGGATVTDKAPPTPSGDVSSGLNGVSCVSKSWCDAVGYWDDGGNSEDLAEHWNGSTWSLVTAPNPPSGSQMSLSAVSCTTSSFCEAVGNYIDGASVQHPLALGWKGSSWTVQGAPDPAGSQSDLLGVSCSGTSCIAVGHYTPNSGARTMLSESFSSSTWSVVATPSEPYGVTQLPVAVACATATNCLAVGARNDSADDGAWPTQVTYAARYS